VRGYESGFLNRMQALPLIPDHEMLGQIAASEYGVVWLARNVCGSYRAVKVVFRDAFGDGRPFEQEFEGIQLFEPISRTHSNLVAILHVGRSASEDSFYYVMEAADDRAHGLAIDPSCYRPRTLSGELRDRHRFSLTECCQLGLQLVAGLGHLHSRGLLHRDVKPSNVIYVQGAPKLADIGLVTHIATPPVPLGTLGYLPARGYGSPGADLYALGKILYEALTGKDRGAFPELPTDWLDGEELDPLNRFNEFLLRACHEDPRARYSSARQMFEDLNRVLPRASRDEGTIRKWFSLLWSKGEPAAPIEQTRLEGAGGAVPLDSPFYVARPADDELGVAIARGDGIILVKGARQMGKTSLLARGLQQARRGLARVVLTDLQDLTDADLSSLESFYRSIGDSLCEQLGLDRSKLAAWDQGRGPNLNFERLMRRLVTEQGGCGLFWGLDEVDRLFVTPFGGQVFAMFRSWYNRRALDPDGPWDRLAMALVCATEAHLFITDLNQSPFNVGTHISLEDFSIEQVGELNRRYGSPLVGRRELARFQLWFDGQPFLTRHGLHEMAVRAWPLERLEQEAPREDGVFGDHLRRLLAMLRKDEALLEALRSWLGGTRVLDGESFYRLRSAGILKGEVAAQARPRCQLYGEYLKHHLI
jgi:hypothetical protein